MRIHTDTLSTLDLFDAAKIARADLTYTAQGSLSRARSFDVHLTGESRRRPNLGTSGRGRSDEYAATWDQWGVFLAVLFERDQGDTFEPSAPMTTRFYRDAGAFADRTADRFGAPEDVMTAHGYARKFVAYGWPEDAHGDHTFRYNGTTYEQKCTKCSAVRRWS